MAPSSFEFGTQDFVATLLTNLLFAIAKDVRYQFDRVQLKKGAYSPQAHGDLEHEQNTVRKLVLKVLSGEKALKMDVASFRPMRKR